VPSTTHLFQLVSNNPILINILLLIKLGMLQDEHGRFVQAYAKRFEGRPAEIRESEAMGVLCEAIWLQISHMNNVQI
jgi:hypothetical protein